MDTSNLLAKFAMIGARLRVADHPSNRFQVSSGVVSLNVQTDREGEFFEVVHSPRADPEISVLDVQKADRHLLLMVRGLREKSKFLCGHDERHWFVAAIPESASVGTVLQAKDALKPLEVRLAEAKHKLSSKACNLRKNSAFRRQGEWFFLPAPALAVSDERILKNEPLLRGNGGKPHWTDECYRIRGETVYVCFRHPNGLTVPEYERLLARRPSAKRWPWQIRQRNAEVYVRGRIRHADHKTVTLHGWHRVVMNTETQAAAMRHVAFLD